MKQLAGWAIAAICAAGAVKAQSVSGPYLGIDVGRVTGNADGDFSADIGPPFGVLSVDDTVPFDGFEVGAFAGIRGTFRGSFMIGIELSGNVGDVEGTESDILNIAGNFDVIGRLRRRGEVSLSVKPGAWIAPGTLVYGILGVQAAGFKFRATGPLGIDVLEEGLVPGWHYGFGAEQALTDRISVRLEYLEHEYGTLDTNVGPVDLSVTPDERAFRLGLIWSFF